MLPCQPIDLVGELARSGTSLEKLRHGRSPVEEFGVDPRVSMTRAEYAQVVNGGGSGGGGLQRLSYGILKAATRDTELDRAGELSAPDA